VAVVEPVHLKGLDRFGLSSTAPDPDLAPGQAGRAHGIHEMWLVDPFKNELRAETKEPAGYVTRILTSGRLESKVVPGFWIEISRLWSRELPPTLKCLREIMG
jgi:hypothetical protein